MDILEKALIKQQTIVGEILLRGVTDLTSGVHPTDGEGEILSPIETIGKLDEIDSLFIIARLRVLPAATLQAMEVGDLDAAELYYAQIIANMPEGHARLRTALDIAQANRMWQKAHDYNEPDLVGMQDAVEKLEALGVSQDELDSKTQEMDWMKATDEEREVIYVFMVGKNLGDIDAMKAAREKLADLYPTLSQSQLARWDRYIAAVKNAEPQPSD